MRTSLWLLAGTGLLSSTAFAAERPTLPPILPGNPTATQIDERCDMFVARSTELQKSIEASNEPPSVDRTLATFDNVVQNLVSGALEAQLYREVSATPESRSAGEKCEVGIGTQFNQLTLSRPLYERIKAIKAPADDAVTQRYLTHVLGSFERSGIGLDTEGRAKARAISDEIAKLVTEFEANIPKAQRSITVTPAELDGLPQDYLDARKPGPDGKITLKTVSTDYFPVMTYANNRELRKRFHQEYNQIAFPLNEPVLRNLINKRDELAKLVDRPHYAALNFEDRMMNTPDKVQKLMDEMAEAARPAAGRDYAKQLAVLQQLYPGATKLEAWDNRYTGRLVQKQSYGFDREEARKYFAYDNVRDGILKLTEDMFGVDIRPWNAPTWDKLVEAYEMYDQGKLIGRFYFDSHPRPGKYEHANAVPVRWAAGGQVPESALVMNLPAGKGLMEHGDVVTFLHEFGHLLHNIFGAQDQRWAYQSGIGLSTEWDFVEAPSQMLENWVYDYDTLKQFAVDASGKPIPRELVEQMNSARYFGIGMDELRQIGLSNIALQYYLGQAPADLGAAARAAEAKYSLLPMPEYAQFQDSFSHLGGYGAAYYTYRWSLVIADDLFTQFEKNGIRDRATAERYRRLVLARGGTKPAGELVSDFLGRPVSFDAFKAKMEKDQ
jgi:thimet oligopeptidase